MIRCWRLTKRRYAHDALSGEGARLYGGRWNPRGVALVYTSGSQSLAILELLVHLDLEQVPRDMVAIPIDIPESLAMDTFEPESLPADWRRYPAPASLARLGAEWAESGHAAVLRVPSALVPDEWNYLLAPSHPGLAQVAAGEPRELVLDPRLIQARAEGLAGPN